MANGGILVKACNASERNYRTSKQVWIKGELYWLQIQEVVPMADVDVFVDLLKQCHDLSLLGHYDEELNARVAAVIEKVESIKKSKS